MSAAANTVECIVELVGEQLVGIIPEWNASSDITSTKALVFRSGRALVLGDNGSYWVAPRDEVVRRIDRDRQEALRNQRTGERLVQLAGDLEAQPE